MRRRVRRKKHFARSERRRPAKSAEAQSEAKISGLKREPRSSTFKNYGLLQANSMGVVDYTYRGDNDQWCVPMYATRDVHIDKNTRISQCRIMKNQPPRVFTRVEHRTGPDRGGFGSTGK